MEKVLTYHESTKIKIWYIIKSETKKTHVFCKGKEKLSLFLCLSVENTLNNQNHLVPTAGSNNILVIILWNLVCNHHLSFLTWGSDPGLAIEPILSLSHQQRNNHGQKTFQWLLQRNLSFPFVSVPTQVLFFDS